ncbi:hypothetical protein Tco_0742422 [Tanacetum coccineum]
MKRITGVTSASHKLTTAPVSTEEPMRKSNRVKRLAKKSTKALARGVVIRETPKMPLSKKKEKVDVTRGKGIELLSDVALTKETQYEEVRRKSIRDFHKTRPSGSGAAKIIPSVISEGTGVKPRVPNVTEEESSESEAESWRNDEDNNNNDQDSNDENESDFKHETDENKAGPESDQEEGKDDEEEVKDDLVKTTSKDSDDEDETKITDKIEGDEYEEMDYTTSLVYNYMDIRLNEPVQADDEMVREEGTDAAMTNVQQGNENPEIIQVIEDAHMTLSIVPQQIEVLVTSSSHSSDLAAKFLNFLDIPHADAEIVSLMDVHVHHEVPSQQIPTFLTVPILVISDSSPVFSTVIPQSLPSFTPPPQQSTSTPPPTTEAKNPPSTLLDFASVFQFNNKVTTLEKEVAELKKDPLHTQVTALVDDHLDTRLGATREEFMNFLSASLTARITEQVKNQLPQILLEEVSNFAPTVIQKMIQESLEDVVLAKESSQPQSSYEAAATLIEFELKKILIDKIDKSESFLAAPEHRECYEGLKKSYDLDMTIFSTYDRGLKKRKTSKDAEPTKGLKAKESQSGSSKGTKSQSKSSKKFVQLEEPEFEVADSNMPQDQEENLGKDDEEPKEKVASKRDWFTKPTQPQEPIDPDWNVDKTPQQGQNQSWLMTLASSTDKPSKTFDELMSTPIDFSAFIMNGLKINNLTQGTLLGPAFRLLKGTRSNYAELEYDFEECYKALLEKLDWENPEGGDYPFDLTKPLPLVMSINHQKVPADYFFNNDLKYLQGVIKDMVLNIWVPVKVAYDKHALWGISHWREQHKSFYGYARGLQSRHYVYSTKRHLAVTRVEVMRKYGYRYLKDIVVRRADNDLYRFKEGDFPRLCINDIEDMLLLKRVEDLQLRVKSYQKKINVTKPETTKSGIRKRDPYTPYQDPQGFIYVDNNGRNRLMRSDELYKFSDRALTGLRTSLDDIIKNIRMEYLPQRRWSTLEKKRANIMIKAIDKQLKERRMMRSLKKFIGGRHYGTDLRLLQRTI